MKKVIIGALVGGILMFAWQTLSWTIFDLHRPANNYTPKQDAIISFLNEQFNEDGSYMIPSYPPGSSNEVMEQHMKEAVGKPWAVVAYHKNLDMNMGMRIFRGLVVDIVIVGIFCWIISGFARPRFSNVFVASLLVGLIAFMNFPYTVYIWFETFDIGASLTDALVGWGLVGLWLGWWYGRKTAAVAVTVSD